MKNKKTLKHILDEVGYGQFGKWIRQAERDYDEQHANSPITACKGDYISSKVYEFYNAYAININTDQDREEKE